MSKLKIKVNDESFEFDSYLATGIAEGFEESAGPEQTLAAWQYLVVTGLAWRLQGWFGRSAQDLINRGVVAGPGNYPADKGIYYEFDA